MVNKKVLTLSGALLCFAFISFYVFNSMISDEALLFDTAIRNFIIGLRNDLLNPIIIGITYLGNSKTIIFICLVFIILKKTRFKIGIPLSITVSCSWIIQTIIKEVVERARPPVENFLIIQGGYSFPSGHSCSGLVFYGFLIYLVLHTAVDKTVYKIFKNVLIILILLLGLSRIYVGVHYPTDVIAGWSLGVAILTIAICILEKLREHSFTLKK